MLLRITSKRQITFPVRVLDAMGAKPGDQLELTQSGNGYIIRPKRIDYSRLGTLRTKYRPDTRHLTLAGPGNRPMTQPYEIDTSVLVRLTAGKPARGFPTLPRSASYMG